MKNVMLLVFITLAATFTPIFAKLTVAEISPLSLGFFRFGLAAILFYITLKIRKLDLKFEKKDSREFTIAFHTKGGSLKTFFNLSKLYFLPFCPLALV